MQAFLQGSTNALVCNILANIQLSYGNNFREWLQYPPLPSDTVSAYQLAPISAHSHHRYPTQDLWHYDTFHLQYCRNSMHSFSSQGKAHCVIKKQLGVHWRLCRSKLAYLGIRSPLRFTTSRHLGRSSFAKASKPAPLLWAKSAELR